MTASTTTNFAAMDLKIRRLTTEIEVLEIGNASATATISLFGGQVLNWQPRDAEQPVLWMADRASLDGSKAIRGGAPVCWPWFGAHPDVPTQPSHGCARVNPWRLDGVCSADDGTTEVSLSFEPTMLSVDSPMKQLMLSQVVRVGSTLDIALTTTNTGQTACRYTEGLHTYFRVQDIDTAQVTGLDQRDYLDLTQHNQRCRQSGGITFGGELGRLFVNSLDTCTLHDPGLRRNIRVEKSGSRSTAIWNPGLAVATRMSDLGAQGWREMVCVESANAAEDAIVIEPGARRTLTARYSVEPFTPA